jgi:hypothetical protein
MANKLPIKDILAAVDMNAKNVWAELDDDEKKQVSFWLLNRYVSSVTGNRDQQELAVIKTNEYYNKYFNDIGVGKEHGHPQLMWQLLCASAGTEKIEFHEWIGFKKKTGGNDKAERLLERIYPNMKTDEAELLARLSTKKELKQLAEEHGIEGTKL